ncbi:hypothetical protein [Paramagnetospirillum kuznetsovii]|uniref:hypothetical protein n=1 Tax=Paramagnetospirillum kuznetsovii TaxID=2053833 RepID=UPI0011BD5225|nr:hypothetical protein [Paramagnetospirillum kuznetsovii]
MKTRAILAAATVAALVAVGPARAAEPELWIVDPDPGATLSDCPARAARAVETQAPEARPLTINAKIRWPGVELSFPGLPYRGEMNHITDRCFALTRDGRSVVSGAILRPISARLLRYPVLTLVQNLVGEEEDGEAAVAFFIIQGISMMNGFEEYMAVFRKGQDRATPTSPEKPYRLTAATQIGTRWGRTFDWKAAKVTPGQITIRGTKWSDADAGCCPSLPIQFTFAVTPAAGHDTQYPLWRETETILPGKGGTSSR